MYRDSIPFPAPTERHRNSTVISESAWRKRLGLPQASAITVLADGAKWILVEQYKHLHRADGVLDVFHSLQHISAEIHSCTLFGMPPKPEVAGSNPAEDHFEDSLFLRCCHDRGG